MEANLPLEEGEGAFRQEISRANGRFVEVRRALDSFEDGGLDAFERHDLLFAASMKLRSSYLALEGSFPFFGRKKMDPKAIESVELDGSANPVALTEELQGLAHRLMSLTETKDTSTYAVEDSLYDVVELLDPLCRCLSTLHAKLPGQVKSALQSITGADEGVTELIVEQWLGENWEPLVFWDMIETCLCLNVTSEQARRVGLKLRSALELLEDTAGNVILHDICRHAPCIERLCRLCCDVNFVSEEILSSLFMALASTALLMESVELMGLLFSANKDLANSFGQHMEQLASGCENEGLASRKQKITIIFTILLSSEETGAALQMGMLDILHAQEPALLESLFTEIALSSEILLDRLVFALMCCIEKFNRFDLLVFLQHLMVREAHSNIRFVRFLNNAASQKLREEDSIHLHACLLSCLLNMAESRERYAAYMETACRIFKQQDYFDTQLAHVLIEPCLRMQEASTALIEICTLKVCSCKQSSSFAVQLLTQMLDKGLGSSDGLGTVIAQVFLPALHQDTPARSVMYRSLASLLDGRTTIDPVTYTCIEDTLMQHLLSYPLVQAVNGSVSVCCPITCIELEHPVAKDIEHFPELIQYLLRTLKRGGKKKNRLANAATVVLHQLSDPVSLCQVVGLDKAGNGQSSPFCLSSASLVLALLELLVNELVLHSKGKVIPFSAVLELISMHMVLSGEANSTFNVMKEEYPITSNPIGSISIFLSLEASMILLHKSIYIVQEGRSTQDTNAGDVIPPNLLAYIVALTAAKLRAQKDATKSDLVGRLAVGVLELLSIYLPKCSSNCADATMGLQGTTFPATTLSEFAAAKFLASEFQKHKVSGHRHRDKYVSKGAQKLPKGGCIESLEDTLTVGGVSRLCTALVRLYSYIFCELLEHSRDGKGLLSGLTVGEEKRKITMKHAIKKSQPCAGRAVWNAAMQVAGSCPLEGTRLFFALSFRDIVEGLSESFDADTNALAVEVCHVLEALALPAEREIANLSQGSGSRRVPSISHVPLLLLQMTWDFPIRSSLLLKPLLRVLFQPAVKGRVLHVRLKETSNDLTKYALQSLYSCFGSPRGRALQLPDDMECRSIAYSEVIAYIKGTLHVLEGNVNALDGTCTAQFRKFIQCSSTLRWLCLVGAGVECPLPATMVKTIMCFKDSSTSLLSILLMCTRWSTCLQESVHSLVAPDVKGCSLTKSVYEDTILHGGLDVQDLKAPVVALASAERLVSAIHILLNSHDFSTWPSLQLLPAIRSELERYSSIRKNLFAWSEGYGRERLLEEKRARNVELASVDSGDASTRRRHAPSEALADMLYNAFLEAEQADMQEFEFVPEDQGEKELGQNENVVGGDSSKKRRRRSKILAKSKCKKNRVRSKRRRSLNPFIDAVMSVPEYGSEDSADNYSDLEDFIVCKPGKNYRKVVYKYSTAHDLSD